MRQLLLLLIVVGAVTVTGCYPTQVSAVPTPTRGVSTPLANSDDLMNQTLFEGIYAYGFETSLFKPCGVEEQWWVIPDSLALSDELKRAYDTAAGMEHKPVYTQLRGRISQRGAYGHLDAYQRQFLVREIVGLRVRGEGDCA